MISNMKKRSLPIKITLSFLLFLLIPVYVTQIILFINYKNNMDSTVKNYLLKTYENGYTTMNNRFLDMVISSNYFTLNSDFNDIISHYYSGMDRQFNEDVEKMDGFFDFAQSITKLKKIYYTLVLDDGRVFGNWGTLPVDYDRDEMLQWVQDAEVNDKSATWDVLGESFLFENSTSFSPPLISVTRNVRNKGILILGIEYSEITDFLELNNVADKKLTTLIFDRNGQIMYKSNNSLSDYILRVVSVDAVSSGSVSTKISNRGGYYIFSRRLRTNDWTLVQVIDESLAYSSVLYMRNRFILISLIFLVIFIGTTVLISFGTTRSIKRLKSAMEKFGQGDLNVEVGVTGSDEITELTQNFNQMVKQIQYLIHELKENEREKTQIYYESLIAQINPHFLYNTLNSIKWAAALSNAPNVVNLLISLGTLLEASTSRGGDIVTLGKEIEYVKHYMNLQYSRFGEKIKLHYYIPSETVDLLIPKFIIQPLVENSIIHAFDQHERKGDIFIKAALNGTYLLVFVEDNGNGISTERIVEILNDQDESDKRYANKQMGIGISSVHKRIQILYGKEYGLIFSTEAGSGSTFRLKLPLRHAGDNSCLNGGNDV